MEQAQAIGRTRWCLADVYVPAWSNGPAPEFTSHDALCVLNAGDQDAALSVLMFFENREPAGPYRLSVPARRTVHFRFNNLRDPEPVPAGIGMACVIEANVPVVVQQTRLDSRQAENGLFSHMAFPL